MDNWIELLAAHEHVRELDRSEVPEHKPVAAVLSCSDARVSPSVIFNQDAGQLFVVRVAGNVATPTAVASLDYAVAELGVPLLIVLGHTSCGAVGAACAGVAAGYLEPVIGQITTLVGKSGCSDANELAERNVRATIDALTSSDSPVGDAIRAGQLAVRGALYDVAADTLQPVRSPVPM